MKYILISKLVKKKTKAFSLGANSISNLESKLKEYVNSFSNNDDKHIGCNVIDVTKYIYDNQLFYDYLKYSFMGKYYERKINLIIWLILLSFVMVGVILYFILGLNILFIILCAILIILLYIIMELIKTGETYKSYYNRTFYKLLLNSFRNISFTMNNKDLNEGEIDSIIDTLYNKKTTSKNIDCKSNLCSGNTCDLKLVYEKERTNTNGTTTKSSEVVFDGFYVKINLNKNYNKLKGNIIKIKDDENILSSLTEDTVKGVYESDLEFNFNSEEMNKSFDCKVSGFSGFSDVDDMMIEVHKIITPSFEQHLLYLRERYNSFNMNITDSNITLSFNMERSIFQKAKHSELFEFSDSYREANEKLRLLNPSSSGISDFVYYNVFPFMERLYLLNYLTYLYLSYMDFENYYDINSNSINSFEEQMKSIYKMKNKDFKEIYTKKIKQIYKETKNNLKEIKIEEK